MSDGNEDQIRIIANQVADSAVLRFFERYPPHSESNIPAPLKWAGGFAMLVAGALLVGYFNWLTDTVSEMQVTLARIDERQQSASEENKRRIELLEGQARKDHQ